MHLEIFLSQSTTFNGQIIVWQDGVEILRQDNVKTRYPYMGDEWSIASYAGSISPSPATIYFDDATISTGRWAPARPTAQCPPCPEHPGRSFQPSTSRPSSPVIRPKQMRVA